MRAYASTLVDAAVGRVIKGSKSFLLFKGLLDLTLFLRSHMAYRLKGNAFKLEISLDAREVLKNKLLASRLVDLTVGKC